MIELSPSKIQTYMTCPLSYYFRYVEKIQTIKNGRAWMGSAVHKGIETAYNKQNNQAGIEEYLKSFRAQDQEINWQEEEPINVEKEGLNLLQVYLESKTFKNLKILNTEYEIFIPFSIAENLKTIQFIYDSDTQDSNKIHCILDAATKNGIIDWKTTKRKWTQDQIERNIQFNIYALAFLYLNGQQEVPIQAHILISKKEPEIQILETKKTQEDFKITRQIIFQIIKAIQNEIFYPNPNMLCENYCDYKSLCRCKV